MIIIHFIVDALRVIINSNFVVMSWKETRTFHEDHEDHEMMMIVIWNYPFLTISLIIFLVHLSSFYTQPIFHLLGIRSLKELTVFIVYYNLHFILLFLIIIIIIIILSYSDLFYVTLIFILLHYQIYLNWNFNFILMSSISNLFLFLFLFLYFLSSLFLITIIFIHCIIV